MLDAFTDKYKNKFTHTPIENEKPSKGKIYFLFGNIILQKGYKQRNTMPILKAPNKIGGTDALIPSLPVGYALPKKNITNKINNVCFLLNSLTHSKRIIHRLIGSIKPSSFYSGIIFNRFNTCLFSISAVFHASKWSRRRN